MKATFLATFFLAGAVILLYIESAECRGGRRKNRKRIMTNGIDTGDNYASSQQSQHSPSSNWQQNYQNEMPESHQQMDEMHEPNGGLDHGKYTSIPTYKYHQGNPEQLTYPHDCNGEQMFKFAKFHCHLNADAPDESGYYHVEGRAIARFTSHEVKYCKASVFYLNRECWHKLNYKLNPGTDCTADTLLDYSKKCDLLVANPTTGPYAVRENMVTEFKKYVTGNECKSAIETINHLCENGKDVDLYSKSFNEFG